MPKQSRKPRLLVLSQVYVPDPASVGQHMADAAAEMARRGWDVRVLASSRGYDDPTKKYKLRETIDGVDVRRIPLSSFGKKALPLRILGALSFMAQVTLRGLLGRSNDVLLVSTSPPMCLVAAIIISTFRRARVKFWVMDLNPDQLITLGKIRAGSFPARVMDFFNRLILRKATDVIALDRFMAESLVKKLDVRDKVSVMPPWPHMDLEQPIAHADNPFRDEHGLQGQTVLMYSGNHGIALPLETYLKAAIRFKDDPRLRFMFIGGGVRKKEVEQAITEHKPANMSSLPYQPLERLRFSLSAADVHVVTMGDEVVGNIHPCKVYGAMAVARPILFFGPRPSHVADLLDRYRIGWSVEHGDVDGAERAIALIADLAATDPAALAEMGARAKHATDTTYSKRALMARFCDVLEGKATGPAASVEGGPVAGSSAATPDAAVSA